LLENSLEIEALVLVWAPWRGSAPCVASADVGGLALSCVHVYHVIEGQRCIEPDGREEDASQGDRGSRVHYVARCVE